MIDASRPDAPPRRVTLSPGETVADAARKAIAFGAESLDAPSERGGIRRGRAAASTARRDAPPARVGRVVLERHLRRSAQNFPPRPAMAGRAGWRRPRMRRHLVADRRPRRQDRSRSQSGDRPDARRARRSPQRPSTRSSASCSPRSAIAVCSRNSQSPQSRNSAPTADSASLPRSWSDPPRAAHRALAKKLPTTRPRSSSTSYAFASSGCATTSR